MARSLNLAEPFSQPFQEAVDFLQQKIALPSKDWREIVGRSHDRALVVAGATKEALYNDLASVIKTIPQGLSQREFTAEFERLVAKHGWTGWTGEKTEAGRAWRARVIYETNLKTADAAGRYKQMTHPDVLKRRPYWKYIHGYTRSPDTPRAEHQALDGKVFRADDPIWDTIYPPNGWNCSCGVEPITEEELTDLGKSGPDTPPDLGTHTVVDPRTGQKVQTTNGIDFGWDHAPGQSWARGLVPQELAVPLPPAPIINPPKVQPPLAEFARPFTQPILPSDLKPEDYVDRFLAEFGATRDVPVLFRDPSGHALVISAESFKDGQGRWKVTRPDGRHAHVLRLAEAIRDPDEIWIGWGIGEDDKWRVVRRYLRTSPDSPEFASFSWWKDGWVGATAFSPTSGRHLLPNADYLERQRAGALLWRRPRE